MKLIDYAVRNKLDLRLREYIQRSWWSLEGAITNYFLGTKIFIPKDFKFISKNILRLNIFITSSFQEICCKKLLGTSKHGFFFFFLFLRQNLKVFKWIFFLDEEIFIPISRSNSKNSVQTDYFAMIKTSSLLVVWTLKNNVRTDLFGTISSLQ